MFFWPKKKKPPKKPAQKAASKTISREDAKAQALANARKARAEIGEENLQRLAQLLQQKKEPSPGMKAREIIRAMDKGKVADNLRAMMQDDKK